MEYLIASIIILIGMSVLAGLIVLVMKLTAATVGPAEHQRGFDSCRALMSPQVAQAERERQRLWERNIELENRLQLAISKQAPGLPANTITLPDGYSASVRKVAPKGEQHG